MGIWVEIVFPLGMKENEIINQLIEWTDENKIVESYIIPVQIEEKNEEDVEENKLRIHVNEIRDEMRN